MEKNNRDKEAEDALLMNTMVIFGGPEVGFNTNPESRKRPCFIEVNGQKLVCIAQAGECRSNYNYYSPGLGDRKSWTTPIIEESCPDSCPSKVLVCDDHDEKCEGSITYYPQYNKFRGQFKRYCRNLDKFINNGKEEKGKAGKNEKGKMGRVKTIEEKGKDGKKRITWSY